MGKFHLEEKRAGFKAVRSCWWLRGGGKRGADGQVGQISDKRLPARRLRGVYRDAGWLLSGFTYFTNVFYP